MRLLLALFVFFASTTLLHAVPSHLIIFANDGTFYRFDPQTQQVNWMNSLNFELLSLNIANESFDEGRGRTFIIPTIDGDFLYMDEKLRRKGMKQIVVAREDIEDLLDICFENRDLNNYFVYQKLDYYVLNIEDGQFQNLQEFLKNKTALDKAKHRIMAISKKLLKQMSSQMQVKWSIISSTVSLMDADTFVENPKILQSSEKNSQYRFYRRGLKIIEIQDVKNNGISQIQVDSPIISIFLIHSDKKISKMKIVPSERKLLAIQAKPHQQSEFGVIQAIQNAPHIPFQSFPQTSDYSEQWNTSNDETSDINFCVNSYQTIKKMNGKKPEFIGKREKIQEEFVLPTIPFSSDKQSTVYIPKEQPLTQIFILFILMGSFTAVYFGVKTDKMKKLISDISEQNDEKLNQIRKKLGEYENAGKQLKKMYQVNWEKMILNCKKYFIFEGRFLNQNADVYALPISGNDIIFIEHQLNLLINCSHKSVSKLFYYTRNDDYLLIFTESSLHVNSLSDMTEEQKIEFEKKDENYRNLVKDITESLIYLVKNKIQFECFVSDSVYLTQFSLFKVNIIPSLIYKPDEKIAVKLKEIGTNYIRYNLVEIIHSLGHRCEQFDIEVFEKQKNTDQEENFFLKDFYDFVLTGEQNSEEKKDDSSESENNNFTEIILHPFLWQSKQKMLFISEFSNYLETNADEIKVGKMQSYCKKHYIIKVPWNKQLHHLLTKEMNNFRKYDFASVKDLIRFIRNKTSHYHELPKETKLALGKTPQEFVEYFLRKFPKLLPFMHIYVQKKKWKLHIQ